MLKLTALRVVISVFIAWLVENAAEVEHGKTLVFLLSALGVVAGSFFANRPRSAGILLLGTVVFIFLFPGLNLSLYSAQLKFQLGAIFFIYWFVSTICFWRYKLASTAELVLFTAGALFLFKAHRNYNVEAIEFVREASWELGVQSSTLIIFLGTALLALLLYYLFVASRRSLVNEERLLTLRARGAFVYDSALAVLFVFLLVAVGVAIDGWYEKSAALGSEGVGTSSGEGESPLGFHSDVGKSNTVAALVRLEEDYLNNPWSPMLYLREQALSKFNGREMVQAEPGFDRDTPAVRPGGSYELIDNLPASGRTELTHSVYILTKHPRLFAIDYPLSIRPIINPEPKRFLSTYRVVSQVPSFSLEELVGLGVGEESWSEQWWEHYLEAPGSKSDSSAEDLSEPALDNFGEDLRYKALAKKIVGDETDPVKKVFAIVEYLSRESIYTRSPGHSGEGSTDPVAPYLFAKEPRGYCVHFAHAASYLMRLSGVPARIGTGYLIDLKYAKDGHALLHHGDRHAWPEAYISNVGWVAIDVTPERAEGEQELVPDQELLTELMEVIDPTDYLDKSDEELLPDDGSSSDFSPLALLRLAVILLCLLLVVHLVLKLWLRAVGKDDIYRAYRAYYVDILDRGLRRELGETRKEFSERAFRETGVDGRGLAALIGESKYGDRENVREDSLGDAIEQYKTSSGRNILGYFRLDYLNWFRRW